MRDPKTFTSLLAMLQDTDIDVRQMAADGLGKLGDARAMDSLLPLLRIVTVASARPWPMRSIPSTRVG